MISHALKILTLLSSRRRVTRSELMKECELSKRSIYRYVTKLSEANIPIYFDRNYGGYRLAREMSIPTNYFSEFDIVLMRLGLEMLRPKLDGRYETSIEIIVSLLDRLSLGVMGSELGASVDMLANYLDSDNLAQLVSHNFVLRAGWLSRGVRVDVLDVDGVRSTKTIKKPGLLLKDEWYLQDLRDSKKEDIPLSLIIDMKLI